MIHALENCDPKTRVLANSMLLSRRASGVAGLGHKELMLSIIEQTGSLQYTVEVLSVLRNEIIKLVDLMDRRTGKVNTSVRSLLEGLEVKKDRLCK